MPCSPTSIVIPTPSAPSGSPLAGFGLPFTPTTSNISPFPAGFPEDLLDLLNNFQFLIPPGALKPSLNPNFSKDVFDALMSMLNQFMPFLMLYKFFLPVLNLLICVIEVLCSLTNPFKLISAINRLFSVCIPEFLNLFPVFALIVMIISLLLLLLALVEYLILQIEKLVGALLRNINALTKAFQNSSSTSILAIAAKLGSLLCIFQNLFVILSIFDLVISIFKDILSKLFSIPPCDDSNNGNTSKCCTPDVCPAIIKNGDYTRTTGVMQYVNQVGYDTSGLFTNVSPAFSTLFSNSSSLRTESWQIFDQQQPQEQQFINITNAFDVPADTSPFPVFFPTDGNYSATTAPNQAAYTLNLRFLYDPGLFGRSGDPRFIRFNNCIVLKAPTNILLDQDNHDLTESTGVLYVAGGYGFEDDNTTVLTGFAADGYTPISSQASLNNFIHKPADNNNDPASITVDFSEATFFNNLEYTFQPNLPVLLSKNLITLGCEPSVSLNRTFINNVVANNINLNNLLLNNLVNGVNGQVFPDPAGTQQCLATALTALRNNLSTQGVADFQTTTTTCLTKLQDDSNSALTSLIGIGANPCTSTLSTNVSNQFTTQPLTISVVLNENNGNNIATNLPASVASSIAQQLKIFTSFGQASNFVYDGYGVFTATVSSAMAGSGTISVSFNDSLLCTNDIANSLHTIQAIPFNFIYSSIPATGEPRRDEGDVSREKEGS